MGCYTKFLDQESLLLTWRFLFEIIHGYFLVTFLTLPLLTETPAKNVQVQYLSKPIQEYYFVPKDVGYCESHGTLLEGRGKWRCVMGKRPYGEWVKVKVCTNTLINNLRTEGIIGHERYSRLCLTELEVT